MTRKPLCVVVTGRPGSGKTTLARLLGERLRLPVIHRDAIKEGVVFTQGLPHDALPSDTNAVASDLFFETVQRHVDRGVSVVAEAAFQHRVWCARLDAVRAQADVRMVVCTLDPQIAAARYRRRAQDDPRWERLHGVAPPPDDYAAPDLDLPTLAVATGDGDAPSVEEIVRWIGGPL